MKQMHIVFEVLGRKLKVMVKQKKKKEKIANYQLLKKLDKKQMALLMK
jgi:hypothetical protein